MREFDAVVFDMDGVIFDSEKLVIACWKVIAKRYHIANIEEACRECFGMNREVTKQKMLCRYGADFPYDQYKQEMSNLYHERYGNGRLPMKPWVEELLDALRSSGKRIALASSTRECVVKQELEDAHILRFFDKIICGDMVKKSKPEPDIFLKACECLEVQPERAYAIEDSYNGIRSAYKAGMRPIMVPDLAEPTNEMHTIAEVIFPSLKEVEDYLLSSHFQG